MTFPVLAAWCPWHMSATHGSNADAHVSSWSSYLLRSYAPVSDAISLTFFHPESGHRCPLRHQHAFRVLKSSRAAHR